MKETTKLVLDLLAERVGKFGCSPSRRSFVIWTATDLVSVGIFFLHREWPNGAVTIHPCTQGFWHEVDRRYAETISEKYRKYAFPTCVIQSKILPPLVFSYEENTEDVLARFDGWMSSEGGIDKRALSSLESIYGLGIEAISGGGLVIPPILTFIMDRVLNPNLKIQDRCDFISERIERDWDREQFMKLYSSYARFFPNG